MIKEHIAIDIGASSGRVVVLSDAKFQVIHRFENKIVDECWDIDSLYNEIILGLKKVKTLKASISIDTWGCDVVYLDKGMNRIGNPRSYRYCETEDAIKKVETQISPMELYQMSGTQFQPFNTLYQLVRDLDSGKLEGVETMMFIADYLMYRLTGVIHQEITMASTSQLLDIHTKTWNFELIEKLGLPKHLFLPLTIPGTNLGNILEPLPYEAQAIVTGSHDTASAFYGAKDRNNIIVSCGTWSLVGVHTHAPILDKESMDANFTHELGTDGSIRFLKNIPGMWTFELLRSAYDDLDYETIIGEARLHPTDIILDLQDERFLMPESITETIDILSREKKQIPPQNRGEYTYTILNSLAHEIHEAVEEIETLSHQTYLSINVVGGGSQNEFLMERIQELTKKEIITGPVEASVIGNMLGTKGQIGEPYES